MRANVCNVGIVLGPDATRCAMVQFDGGLALFIHGSPESLIRLERAIRDQRIAMEQEIEAEAKVEAARVADPSYTPTLDEALRHPAEFVAGMEEIS